MANQFNVEIKRFCDSAILPAQATPGSAGMDVYTPREIELHYGRQIIPCGWGVGMPANLHMDSRGTSGYSAFGLLVHVRGHKEPIRIEASVELGLIDSDYPKETGVIINITDQRLRPNKWFEFWRRPLKCYLPYAWKISQIIFIEDPIINFVEVKHLSNENNGHRTGGFGSTENGVRC